MDVAAYLRNHSRVVQKGGRPLVSVGYSFRQRKFREAMALRHEREREDRRAWSRNPDNPALTARRRAELLAERERAESSE